MIAVMIIPTGIGCEIGGHAGDATPAARLIGSCCDKLILHPNVVNASDINEMPENALYVEGSMLDRFLLGGIQLKEVKQNKILVVVNKPVRAETVNAVNASRVTLGIDAEIMELENPLRMIGKIKGGCAVGDAFGCDELIEQVSGCEFDALAITSLIEVSRDTAKKYFKSGGVNPWGGVEAMLSRFISTRINKPVAHAPIQPKEVIDEERNKEWDFVCDGRMAPEIISNCFLHSVLKGLHRAPRIGYEIKNDDVDVMISPADCWGAPHKACVQNGIPIIEVMENKTIYSKGLNNDQTIRVENYLEAAGMLSCMRAGIMPESVRRPLSKTKIR